MASILQDVRNQMPSPVVASPKTRQILNSPLSFRTARTTQSSQVSIPPIDFESEITKASRLVSEPQYRNAKVLPYELRQHCLVYFEEQLYLNGLTLWNNVVSSGSLYPVPANAAFVPPASHLAFACTLLVHPIFTTKAPSMDRLEVSSEALMLLKNVLATLGPINANLGEACTFSSSNNLGLRQSKRLNGSDGILVDRNLDDKERDFQIRSFLAGESSLWKRGQDFWHVVGWAFNCSIKYPKRWEYWRVWMEYMLNLLDDDWKERSHIDDKAYEAKRKRFPHPLPVTTSLQDSILMTYLSGHGTSSTKVRRVVKSIFANGSTESIRLYPEVFDKETKDRDSEETKRKRGNFDIDEDQYGDYDREEDTDSEPEDSTTNPSQNEFVFSCSCGINGHVEDGTAQISCDNCNVWQHTKCLGITKKAANSKDFSFVCETCRNPDVEMTEIGMSANACDPLILGGPEAVVLRQRLIALLSRASASFPDSFTSVVDLYMMLFESINPLPVPEISLIMSPSPHLPDLALSSLAQLCLTRLLPNSTPISGSEDDALTQDILKRCFLPFAANTSSVADNAKVSILVETLFRLFIAACPVEPTANFIAAVEKGIAAREAKILDRRRKNGGPKSKEEAPDRVLLKRSGDRLRYLVKFAEKKAASSKLDREG